MQNAANSESWLPGWVVRAQNADRITDGQDPASQRLRRAMIAADSILPPARQDPRSELQQVPLPPLAANVSLSPQASRPYAAHPSRTGGAITLHALEGFTWGQVGGQIEGHTRRKGQAPSYQPRICSDHVLIYLTAGSLRLKLPRIDRLLQAGSVTFIPAGTAFALGDLASKSGVALFMSGVMIQRIGAVLPKKVISGPPCPSDAPAIAFSIDELGRILKLQSKAPVMDGLLAQLTNRLAMALARIKDDLSPPSTPPDFQLRARMLVGRYIRLIQRDIELAPTLADLAQGLGVTAGILDRSCRYARGCSALDLLYAIRLERAVHALRHGGDSIATIAGRLGYAGPSHLNRAFMAATGRPAEDFRRTFL